MDTLLYLLKNALLVAACIHAYRTSRISLLVPVAILLAMSTGFEIGFPEGMTWMDLFAGNLNEEAVKKCVMSSLLILAFLLGAAVFVMPDISRLLDAADKRTAKPTDNQKIE
ncbi:hypothetical protein [Pseudomonas koreensis]|uniref:hypothetical protein n=1 Tax=Pseudomonas koreensis TaxID=198620 RepID=UPI001B33B7FC|nr:hypothetical protein [Pseudomonas koreensis]MBP3998216.1 hypothetical protein [Pseudomonas koreensis]